MSHFAVYALTRNVGIDIVPPAPLFRGCSPGIPGAIFLSRISDFAKFLRAGRVIAPPSRSPARAAPECQARIFWQRRYTVRRGGAHISDERPRVFFSSPTREIFANSTRASSLLFNNTRIHRRQYNTPKGIGKSRLHCETRASNI